MLLKMSNLADLLLIILNGGMSRQQSVLLMGQGWLVTLWPSILPCLATSTMDHTSCGVISPYPQSHKSKGLTPAEAESYQRSGAAISERSRFSPKWALILKTMARKQLHLSSPGQGMEVESREKRLPPGGQFTICG